MSYACCSHCEGRFCVGFLHGHDQPCTRWPCGPFQPSMTYTRCGHCGFIDDFQRQVPCEECSAMVCPGCVRWMHHDPPVLVWELP